MRPLSGSATSRPSAIARASRRVHYRHPIQSLVYVTLDDGNGGIIRNLSQDGAAIQAVGSLGTGQSMRVRFDLANPRTKIDVRAQVTWANASGQAGVRFTDLPRHSARQLNDWIFAQLLRGLEKTSPVFNLPGQGDELILSASARPAIRLPAITVDRGALPQAPQTTLAVPWWPHPISPRGLAKLMDGLILFSAVLMFFCGFLAVAHTLPTWPIAILLGIGVAGFFSALYGFVCSWIGCGTPGAQLAKIAMGDSDTPREEDARFR